MDLKPINKQIKQTENVLIELYLQKAHHYSFKIYPATKEQKDLEESYCLIFKILDINPNHQDALNLYAQNLRYIEKKYQEAIEIYTRLIDINPNYKNAITRRGLCKQNLKDFKGALEDFDLDAIINNTALDYNHYISRGIINEKSGNLEEALIDYSNANSIQELDNNHLERVAKIYFKLNRNKASFILYSRLLKEEYKNSKPSNEMRFYPPLLRYFIGILRIFIEQNEKDKALKILKYAKIAFPIHPRVADLEEEINKMA